MDRVLFCPFCREAFEGESRCPEHELQLLPWNALPPEQTAVLARDTLALAWWSPALGRGWVAAGAGLCTLAFLALPLAVTEGTTRMGGVMLQLALLGAPRLWLLPAGVIAQLSILLRRRTPAGMRGARLAMLTASLVPLLSVAWAYAGARAAVAQLANAGTEQLSLRLASGSYAVLVGTLVACAGALRLGVVRRGHAPRVD